MRTSSGDLGDGFWSARLRRWIPTVLVVVVGLSLVLPQPAPMDWRAWLAVGGAFALFSLPRRGPLALVVDRGGGVVTAVLVVLLVAGTGGEMSVYEDALVVLLVFDGAVRSRRRLAVDTVAVLVAALAPAAYQSVPASFYTDAVVDLTLWVGVAVLVHVTVQRARAVGTSLAAVLDNVDMAVVSADLDGVVTAWNPGAEDLFGWRASEMVGRSIWRVVPDERAEDAAALVGRVRAGASVTAETVRRRADGSLVDVEMTLSPVRDVDGHVAAVSGLYRDLRERRSFERVVRREEEQLRTLGELADGIVYRTRLRPTVAVEYVGSRILPITGFRPEEFRDDPHLPLERTHPDDRDAATRPREVGDAEPGHVLYRFQCADDSWIWLEDHFHYEIEDGVAVAVSGIVFDVSARQAVTLARTRALEREQRAASKLGETVRLQETFLQALSHELRTPLTSITGFAELLLARRGQMDEATIDDLLGRLDRNTRRLSRLLGDLLDVDRSRRGLATPDRSPVDLAELCRRVVGELDPHDGRVELDVEAAVAEVEAGKIERVVDNLVRNALKHTAPDTAVVVRVVDHPRHVVVVVDDEGPGVPNELVGRIFDPFTQGPTATTSPSPGTGIGLAIVDQFTRMHGGSAWYEPRDGGGASFHVRLPKHAD